MLSCNTVGFVKPIKLIRLKTKLLCLTKTRFKGRLEIKLEHGDYRDNHKSFDRLFGFDKSIYHLFAITLSHSNRMDLFTYLCMYVY